MSGSTLPTRPDGNAAPSATTLAYAGRVTAHDELADEKGDIREHWRNFAARFDALGREELGRRWEQARHQIHDNGVSFNVYGDDKGMERPWPLGPMPIIIGPEDQVALARGLPQRARLFDAILADIYGPQRLLDEGLIPAELVLAHPGFLRPCRGVAPAGGVKRYRLVFNLAAGGGTFQLRLHLANPAGVSLDGLIDSTVSLSGVCGGMFNSQRQIIGIVLHAPDASAIKVIQPAPTADPFAQGPRAIQTLFQFSQHARMNHRVRIDGTVSYRQPGGALYIWDGTAGVLVQTAQTDALVVGDEVQVVGFPVMGEWTPVLEDAVFRFVRSGPAPAPVATTAEREAGTDGHDARLVTLDAQLLDVIDQRGQLTLAMLSGNVVFNAEVPAPRSGAHIELERGSRLRLTGISVARADNVLKRPTGFKLLLRTPADLKVVARPSWWTLGRLMTALTALAAVLALIIVWVVVLGRRVREQTDIIRGQIQREAMLEDRYRDLFENANDVVFSQDRRGHLRGGSPVGAGYRR